MREVNDRRKRDRGVAEGLTYFNLFRPANA